jgi:starch synthase
VDYEEWNTTNNPYIRVAYSSTQSGGKSENKQALRAEFGLPTNVDVPLFGSIGRLVEQKGVDILLGALNQQLAGDIQFVMLGTGSAAFERAYQDLAAKFPSRAAVTIGFDHGLSHRIEAGCDFFLMPSRFEPCGLNQMYSLRYGTIPIVRITGGLDDTVVDIRENPRTANGIKFGEYSSRALAKAVQKAEALYHSPDLLGHYRQNAMEADFSWERTAGDYVRAYRQSLSQPAVA